MEKYTIIDIRQRCSNVKPDGNGFRCECPVCRDETHLFVHEKSGNVLMYCQKCDAGFKEIMPLLFPDFGQHKQDSPKAKPKIAKQYDHVYKNPDGGVAYYKRRTEYELQPGGTKRKKKFSFHYTDSGGKDVWSEPPNSNKLYNLDLLASATPETLLLIVEGEKCADACIQSGLLATTSNTGAGKADKPIDFSDTDRAMLAKFSNRVVIPDNDAAGAEYAAHFPGAKVLDLRKIWPEIKEKQDIADYLAAEKDIAKITTYQFSEADTVKEPVLSDNTPKTAFTGQPLALNCGNWIADDNGVRRKKTTGGGGTVDDVASILPIEPVALLQNSDSGVEKIELAFKKGGTWRRTVQERLTVASNAKILDLANVGIEVNSCNAKTLVSFLADCVAINAEALPVYKSVSRLGWVGDSFVPYDGAIKFDGEKENKPIFDAVAQAGDFEAWKRYTAKLRENIYLRLMMDAAFASPLIERLDTLPFVFHLWGGTGAGKTVALMVAMSIWGNPRAGKLVRTMNMTQNSMLSTAALLYSIPFAGDELQTIKSQFSNYDQLIMKVTEGIDRGRMKYDQNRPVNAWKCSFLFTGEEPCTKLESGGGVKNRVVEVECLRPVVTDGNSVVSFVTRNYGHAGKAFVEHIASRDIRPQYDQYFSDLLTKTDTTEKQAAAMAMLLTADALAAECLYSDEEPLPLDSVKQFLRSKSEVDQAERAFDYIKGVIAANVNRFGNDPAMSEVWGRIDDSTCLINKNILQAKLNEAGFDFDAIKAKWDNAGHLIKNTCGKYAHQTKVNSVKAAYIKIKLDEEIISSEELPF